MVFFVSPPVDGVYSKKANVNFLQEVASHPLDITFSIEGEIVFFFIKTTSFICVKHMHSLSRFSAADHKLNMK